MRYGMSRIRSARRRDDIEKAMEESLIEVIPRLEKRTHYLATLANIGMLMGLLGTIIGLITAFAAVVAGKPGRKGEPARRRSISVAMNNTALGLIVAITLLLAHMYLETKTTTIVDGLEVASVKFLNALHERKMDPESQQDCRARRRRPLEAPARAGRPRVRGSRIARRQSRNHARYRGRNDINIVPMLDVMTILVFFLIFTAVFSKTHILELNLPANATQQLELPKVLELEVVVRKNVIEIADRGTGVLQTLPATADGPDLEGLSLFLQRVKSKFPDKRDATVLLEPDVPYDLLVQVMDTVKSFEGMLDGEPARGELFPVVSVGDAPT